MGKARTTGNCERRGGLGRSYYYCTVLQKAPLCSFGCCPFILLLSLLSSFPSPPPPKSVVTKEAKMLLPSFKEWNQSCCLQRREREGLVTAQGKGQIGPARRRRNWKPGKVKRTGARWDHSREGGGVEEKITKENTAVMCHKNLSEKNLRPVL